MLSLAQLTTYYIAWGGGGKGEEGGGRGEGGGGRGE